MPCCRKQDADGNRDESAPALNHRATGDSAPDDIANMGTRWYGGRPGHAARDENADNC
jgi:hypothetical protein